MVKRRLLRWLFVILFFYISAVSAAAQQAGGIRGVVYDKDFDVPLANAEILIAETGQKVTGTDEGNYVLSQIAPGTYTLVFSKQGYTRQVKANVVVSPGQMTEVDASLAGDFTEMEEFVVQDVMVGTGTEAALLDLRMESPALMDSISADLMSQAGASDAASALKLVAGASVQEGKYAVVRGLPDRFVVTQMNGVRLPTADADKRAVQLDQFPASAIESIQVTKTFTPDQQGDASGGAVNIVLKGIPEEPIITFQSEYGWNSQTKGQDDFLTYRAGGVNFWGKDDGSRDIQFDKIGKSWEGAVGVTREDAPEDYKFSFAGGGKQQFDNGITVGGFASFFYERDSSFFDKGINDKYWLENPGDPMTPQYTQGSPNPLWTPEDPFSPVQDGDFKTSLFDWSRGSEEVKWGTLDMIGIETENHALSLLYMYTRTAEDTATLLENTRGKEYYFPGYDKDDPEGPGNQNPDSSPYLRLQTLKYTERTTQTLQLSGRHTLPVPEVELGSLFRFLRPELDWTVATSSATLSEPDKRQFGSQWWGPQYKKPIPPFFPGGTTPAQYLPFKPAANFTIGNIQRIWKDISEDSDQYFWNLKFPFEQWSGDEGYVKVGYFKDQTEREYIQESFSNFGDNKGLPDVDWNDFWSDVIPFEKHNIKAADIDVDYDGEQEISAWYYMIDLPLTSYFNLIGGVRYESTELGIINHPEQDSKWVPPGGEGLVELNPGDADVFFEQDDTLPSVGFLFTPFESITLRGSYTQTVARQTFKELSPIIQTEFLGGDVFIGNPELKMASLKNYDLRFDYTPYDGGLFSISWFHKDVTDAIEYVQRVVDFPYTTPRNYPEGELTGIEVETRQRMGQFWSRLEGLSLGANATFIDSEVTLEQQEQAILKEVGFPITKRDMTNAPEHLYNFFLTYDIGLTGTRIGLFYTVKGDTLVAGAGQKKGNFIPDVYETEFGTLNLSVSQKLGETWKLTFKAKNLLDPDIETVYRSRYIDDDVTKTSYRKGREYSVSLSAVF